MNHKMYHVSRLGIYLLILGFGIFRPDGLWAADAVTVDGSASTVNKPLTVSESVSVTDDTSSTSTSTGALKVSGGVGIAENVNIGGTLKLTNGTAVDELSTDGTLADDSDTAVPTEKAVKTYVDTAIGSQSGGFSTGDIKQTMATTEPDGWLFLNGQAVSRTGDTAALFALFGTTYGVGDGSTTFNLPDARGCVLASIDNMGGTSRDLVTDSSADSVGGQMGAENHTLTESEMPSHNHGGVTSTAGAHTHNIAWGQVTGMNNFKNIIYKAEWRQYKRTYDMIKTESAGNHSHTINSQGGGQSHNNMQPTLFVNFLIKE